MQSLRNTLHGLLRRSGSLLKVDAVYIAQGNFWQIFNQIITTILTLGLTILFANLLPKETYGLYRYILSLAGVLNIFTLTGMNRAVAQAVAAGNEGSFKTTVKYQLKWNLMQFVAFLILATYYFINDNNQLGIAMIVLGIFSPITFALNTYGAYLEGKRNFRLNNLFSTLSTIIYVLGMALVILISDEVIWLVVAYSAATFGSTILFYYLTIKKFHPSESPSDDVIKYGKELTLIGAMGPIVSQIDKIVLSHFWGASQLAVYYLATAVPDRATTFIKSWVGIALPKFSTKTPEELNSIFYTRIFQGMAVGLLCFLGYFLVAPYLFKYLLPKYIEGVFYSQLLALSFIFAMPNRYIGLLLISQRSSKVMFTSNFIQGIIRIILYIVLGIWGGIIGLITASVSMSFVGMLINITAWRMKNPEVIKET